MIASQKSFIGKIFVSRKGTPCELCLKGNSNLDHFLVMSGMLGGYR
jgi:hypothetical protein